MQYQKILLLTLLIQTILTSCNSLIVPKHIKQNFSNCYADQNTSLDTLINIQGYYRTWEEYDRFGINAIYEHQLDTIFSYFLFYPDGITVEFFPPGGQSVEVLINDIITTSNRGKKHNFFRYNNWGCYSIKGDTIVSQNINHARSLNQYYGGYEIKFVIINNNTLLYEESKPLSGIQLLHTVDIEQKKQRDQDFMKAFGRNRIVSDTLRFFPLIEIPTSDCWLKKKRWFWCKKK